MNRRWLSVVFCAVVCGSGWTCTQAAEVILSENFDGPGVKPGQSILDSPLNWKLVGPNEPAKNSVGNVLLGAGKFGWTGNYLDGSTAAAQQTDNFFRKDLPAINSGQVVLSCRGFASGGTSAGSSIGLCPAQPQYFERGGDYNRSGGWTSTKYGWAFWVCGIKADVYPQGEQKDGSYRLVKQALPDAPTAHDVTVYLKMTVDLDRNKTWGEARWTDAQGRAHEFKSDVCNWDSAPGNISGVFVDIDKSSGHTGIALDDLRVEGNAFKPHSHPFDRREHVVQQLNGDKEPISLPAEMQWISKPWNGENAQMPYLVYMPEKDRLLMTVWCRQPCVAAVITSDDRGKTWSQRRWMGVDKAGQPTGGGIGLAYLGHGRLLALGGDFGERWLSSDYGQTWTKEEAKVKMTKTYLWDPPLVVTGADGRVERLVQGCYKENGIPWPRGAAKIPYSQGYVLISRDEGQTWPEQIKVPQWLAANEVTVIRAKNGDFVAACRTDNVEQFAFCSSDQYSGLGVSVSKDEGKTWSKLNVLHEWGRHHPSMVVLPDGRIVLTYVVRAGYPFTADGYPQFGVEAVISNDNGQTWDMEHRYVLAKWTGNIRGDDGWYCGVQSTSTVLLPDGTLLTPFGTGFRNMPGASNCLMDVALVHWRLASQ